MMINFSDHCPDHLAGYFLAHTLLHHDPLPIPYLKGRNYIGRTGKRLLWTVTVNFAGLRRSEQVCDWANFVRNDVPRR